MAKDDLTFTYGKDTKVVLRSPGGRQNAIFLAITSQLASFGNASSVFGWHAGYVESCASKAFEWPTLTLRDCSNFDAVYAAWEKYLDGPANDLDFMERLGNEIKVLTKPVDEELGPPPKDDEKKVPSGG